MSRLTCSSADQDVKKCYQDLITHAANLFESDFGNLLPVITQRLDNEIIKCQLPILPPPDLMHLVYQKLDDPQPDDLGARKKALTAVLALNTRTSTSEQFKI
ncbi:hypothetical protein PCASD_00612 [Puccinia coronata f. sp. avenae]|uniref:Uncharacterized protein n=1 Tax=Puccinia coronata f. sp. avenae TaxID=200324 RepID=A0A2N5VNP5_9BASI|nr:hypothetical protein PCASD_00612 [Puccinia coronata f. sp. avenae]